MTHTILIADDQRHIRQFCQQELESAGFRVVAVEDGDAALDALENLFVDLVILDEHMPRCRGIEVGKRIRQCYPGLPVILFTADPFYERFHSPWIDAVVAKSADLVPLEAEITRLLESAVNATSGADSLVFPDAPVGVAHSCDGDSRGRRPTYA